MNTSTPQRDSKRHRRDIPYDDFVAYRKRMTATITNLIGQLGLMSARAEQAEKQLRQLSSTEDTE